MRQLYLGLTLLLSCFAFSVSGQITGTFTVCPGGYTSLSGSPAGGTWSSSNASVAMVGTGSGMVYGVAAGTAIISYSSWPTPITVTVNPAPSPITGTTSITCGGTTTLSDAASGGTWSSLYTSIATIGATTGIVTGVSAGNTIVTYAFSSGCYSIDSIYVTGGTAGTLSGVATLCVGATTTLTSTVSGGTWSSAMPIVATVSSTTGIVTATSVGTATITYTTTGPCGTAYATKVVTVNSSTPTITGSSTVACGGTGTLSGSPTGGTWSSTTTGVATVGASTGIITAASIGTTIISYTATGACGSGSAAMVVTVTAGSPLPAITGVSTVPCGGTTTLSNSVAGGVWNSGTPAVATVSSAGVVTAVTSGTTTVTYTVTGACGTSTATMVVTVTAGTAGTITAASSLCVGATTTASSTMSGGTWSSLHGKFTITSGGVLTGVTSGPDTIVYSITTSCGTATSIRAITISSVATAGPILGTTTITCGSVTTLLDGTTGGIWSSSTSAVGSIGATTGIVTGITAGTTTISYTVPVACGTAVVTATMTVTGPSIFAIDSPLACGAAHIAYAFGASSYTWAPATGLSCSTCSTTNITAMATTIYTITGTTSGCSSTTLLTVNGNRIDGHVTFSSTTPSVQTCKVWLVQYNPIDSSISGVDSIVTCMDGSSPYYHFDSKAAGNYLVKAKLLSSVAGTSGYIPTYGASSSVWSGATNIAHASAANIQDINMIYGTVPAGPGFISGYVYSGAGKGTSGDAAVVGMLIYLKDATSGNILTYTYTDATGAYTFGSLAYGSYIVYPEQYDNYTTPSAVKTLSASSPSATGVTFKQYTTSRQIKPYQPSGVPEIGSEGITIHPNPSTGLINISWNNQMSGNADVVISDVTGREVYRSVVNMNATTNVNLSDLKAGMYIISVRSANNSYVGKLLLDK